MEENKVRGKIYEKFPNISAFAKEIGYTVATVSRKLSGNSKWTYKDVCVFCKALDISMDEADKYFF